MNTFGNWSVANCTISNSPQVSLVVLWSVVDNNVVWHLISCIDPKRLLICHL